MTNVLMGTLKPTHSLTYYLPNTLFQLNEFLVPTTAEKNYTVNNDSAGLKSAAAFCERHLQT